MRNGRSDFPEGFLFGTATSAYQIEGHGQGGAGTTHWDTFAATPGNVKGAEDGHVACDHLNRYEEDLDLVAGANLDVYRFSTSWARVMPGGTGVPNEEGLDFYDRLVDALLERNLKPAATLYHWELPSPLADRGGWANRDVAGWFADFTHVVMSRIGDRVWSAAPINEPWCVAWLSHFVGEHAPGLRDIRAASRAIHHVLLAHGRAIDAMRALGMGNLGAVCNFEYANTLSDDAADQVAADRFDAIYNRSFAPMMFGTPYPDILLEGIGRHLPHEWENDIDQIARPLDWFGVNYYTRTNLVAAPGPWPSLDTVDGPLQTTSMGWEIYPDGLHHFLIRLHRETTGDLPIYVTENGLAAPDEVTGGRVPDPARSAYLDDHLDAVRRAIADGAPVAGYFVWSLLDNYEWAKGYAQRFGLVHVDFETLRRTPKESYHALSEALAR